MAMCRHVVAQVLVDGVWRRFDMADNDAAEAGHLRQFGCLLPAFRMPNGQEADALAKRLNEYEYEYEAAPALEAVIAVVGQGGVGGVWTREDLERMAHANEGLRMDGDRLIGHIGVGTIIQTAPLPPFDELAEALARLEAMHGALMREVGAEEEKQRLVGNLWLEAGMLVERCRGRIAPPSIADGFECEPGAAVTNVPLSELPFDPADVVDVEDAERRAAALLRETEGKES